MKHWVIAARAAAAIGVGLAAASAGAQKAAPVGPPAVSAPGQVFRDCAAICPEMVVVPAGGFMMGSTLSSDSSPVHRVTLPNAFAVGRFEVTFAEWDACVAASGCIAATDPDALAPKRAAPSPKRERYPVDNISWNDAQQYLAWLSAKTGAPYRLLSEAEWEYAARAGTTTPFNTGEVIALDDANFSRAPNFQTGAPALIRDQRKVPALPLGSFPVGSFAPNGFGLYDMHGNVAEWVQDCFNRNYNGAPANGAAWTAGECKRRQQRGGFFDSPLKVIRSDHRANGNVDYYNSRHGFRVARAL